MTTTTTTTTIKPISLMWGGFPPSPTARIAWGARAIFNLLADPVRDRRGRLVRYQSRADLDIPYDRQEMQVAEGVGECEPERRALVTWINDVGLPKIRTLIEEGDVNTGSPKIVAHASPCGRYQITASPRASHGYLYIVAWTEEVAS